MQHWTKLKCTGGKPPARTYHATCCIAGTPTGQQHPLLMVIGGWGDGLKVFSDVWLLDMNNGVWSEVSMIV